MNSLMLNRTCPYADEKELLWIREFVSRLPWHACVVMIGAGPGVMAMACFEGNPKLETLYVVELNTVAWMLKHLELMGIEQDRIYCLQGYSWDIGRDWPFGPIDLLIVDGDHSYEAVTKDITNWVSHVKDDGVIFFHDYLERENGFNGHGEWEPSGVAKAIWESGLSLVQPVGISMVCKK